MGLGLIGIGREWGHAPSSVPSEKEALAFLDFAYELGIKFFDTAASYGNSEERLGKFLKRLSTSERQTITVATKFGDHWDEQRDTAYVDHSFDALRTSLERSLERLGRIDLMQIHKATVEALHSDSVCRAAELARTIGISVLGASVSDEQAGQLACEDEKLSVIQLPYNQNNLKLAKVIKLAQQKGKTILINRPYNMGALLYQDGKQVDFERRVAAYRHVLGIQFKGVILTGTKSQPHLAENWKAFNQACESHPKDLT